MTYQSSFLYYCLRCQHHNQTTIASAKMRVCGNKVSCSDCNSETSVLKIQTVGCLVYIFGNFFCYCVRCMLVHAWQVRVSDMENCAQILPAVPRLALCTSCIICNLSTNSSPLEVLDHELGVKQYLVLGPNHSPPSHEQHMVHNLPAIRFYSFSRGEHNKKRNN